MVGRGLPLPEGRKEFCLAVSVLWEQIAFAKEFEMFAFFICCGSLEQAIALMWVSEMFFQLSKYTQILSMYHSVQVWTSPIEGYCDLGTWAVFL